MSVWCVCLFRESLRIFKICCSFAGNCTTLEIDQMLTCMNQLEECPTSVLGNTQPESLSKQNDKILYTLILILKVN